MQTPIQENPEHFYRSVGVFNNKTEQILVLFLEVRCEEIHLLPNQKIELLVENNDDFFPMNFVYSEQCIQIYSADGHDWYFKFNGKMYEAGYPSILSELE